jgi:microcystin-dependent protein
MKTIVLLSLFLGVAALHAQTPSFMSYQGRIADSSGALIGAGSPVNRKVIFRIFDAASGGNRLWSEQQTVTFLEGEFSALLGQGIDASYNGVTESPRPAVDTVFTSAGDTRYLEVLVDNGDGTLNPTDTPISPRQRLTSTAYSFRAKFADTLADGAVGSDTLAAGSVTQAKMAANTIGTSILIDQSVTQTKLAPAAVETNNLGAAAVTAEKLAVNAVVSTSIVDGEIRTVDLASQAVTAAKIADNAVTSGKIGPGEVKVGNIGEGAVTGDKIANGTISAEDLDDNAVTLSALAEQLKQLLVPTGSVMPFAGDTAPAGWKLCNGESLSQAAYPELYAVINKRFGYGDSAITTFRVPDLRGRFIRGRNNGTSQVSVDDVLRGRDPDASSRIAMNTGGATGDAVGSLQYDEFREHTHTERSMYFGGTGTDNGGYNWVNSVYSLDSGATGGNETRPVNAYMNYIIKL